MRRVPVAASVAWVITGDILAAARGGVLRRSEFFLEADHEGRLTLIRLDTVRPNFPLVRAGALEQKLLTTEHRWCRGRWQPY